MGQVAAHSPALLILAAFSRHEAALRWAGDRAIEAFGPVALRSEVFAFTETDYYRAAMGPDLLKTFFCFERPFDPAGLPAVKLRTNEWEEEYARESGHAEQRPLNLDPGYLTLAKLVLASTKDHSHRLYLGEGIYGEVTLHYQGDAWQSSRWTYADYRRADYQDFLTQCRELLHARRRDAKGKS